MRFAFNPSSSGKSGIEKNTYSQIDRKNRMCADTSIFPNCLYWMVFKYSSISNGFMGSQKLRPLFSLFYFLSTMLDADDVEKMEDTFVKLFPIIAD